MLLAIKCIVKTDSGDTCTDHVQNVYSRYTLKFQSLARLGCTPVMVMDLVTTVHRDITPIPRVSRFALSVQMVKLHPVLVPRARQNARVSLLSCGLIHIHIHLPRVNLKEAWSVMQNQHFRGGAGLVLEAYRPNDEVAGLAFRPAVQLDRYRIQRRPMECAT